MPCYWTEETDYSLLLLLRCGRCDVVATSYVTPLRVTALFNHTYDRQARWRSNSLEKISHIAIHVRLGLSARPSSHRAQRAESCHHCKEPQKIWETAQIIPLHTSAIALIVQCCKLTFALVALLCLLYASIAQFVKSYIVPYVSESEWKGCVYTQPFHPLSETQGMPK